MELIRTNFNPKSDGFQFDNCFDLADFLKIDFPIDLPILRKDSKLTQATYGLCGGMCYGAMDYYLSPDIQIPQETNPDEIPYRLFRYLWKRQLDSLKPPVIGNLFRMIFQDDKYLLQETGKQEIPKLLLELRAKNPTTLVLIRSSLFGDPTDNHQVLATGFDYDKNSGDLKILLYDPNHSKEETHLQIRLASQGRKLDINHPGEVRLRGFFLSPYSREDPV